MSGSNDGGVLGSVQRRLQENRARLLENGRIDENGTFIPNGSVAIPANPQADPTTFIQVPFDQLVNVPEIQQALGVLSRQSPDAPTLNQTRSDLIALAGPNYSPEPNVLDQYANYTYHIKWSITNDIDGSSIENGSQFQNIQKVVIAESGVTAGFNISDFEIENMCAPGPRVQAMLHTNWRMTVKEPYGLSLIDRIYTISQSMGVSNHLTNCHFIEVWFTGYNEDGTVATTAMKGNIYRLFRVNVTKIQSDTTSAGSTYQIEGVLDNMYANADHVAIAANGLNIGPVNTVGEFFDRLRDALNAQQRNLQYDSHSRIEYEFQMPSYMRAWQFSLSPSASERNADISVRYSSRATTRNPTISITRGMDISTILYFVISMTDKGREFVAGEQQRPRSGNTSAAPQVGRSNASLAANGMANLLAIHSRTKLIGFDYLINDYVRKVTYTFTEYPTTRAAVDVATVRRTLQPTQQQDRARTQLNSNRYIKAYEYIYSGRNLDITRLDIKLELTWQASIPMQLGENTYGNFSVGPQQDPASVATDILSRYRVAERRRTDAQTRIATLQNAISSNPDRDQVARARAELAIANSEFQSANTEIAQLGNNAQRFQVMWGDLSSGEQVLQNLQVGDRSILSNPTVAANIASRISWSNVSQQLDQTRRNMYLEDVQVMPVNPQQRIPVSFRTNPGPTNQITNIGGESSPDRTGAQQSPGTPPRSRGLVAAILNDVMSAPYLTTIDLEIRGDPYWMGLGNIEENRIIGDGNQAPPVQRNAAWYYSGETGFLLTFRTGEAPNETNGYMEFRQSSIAFAGMYSALKIRNIFSDGKFIQSINAVKDSLLELSAVTSTTGQQTAASTETAAAAVAGSAGPAAAPIIPQPLSQNISVPGQGTA